MIKLISLNVALFETNNEKLYKFLLNEKPDIICLQEVADTKDADVNKVYISQGYIGDSTPGLKNSFFTPTWEVKDFHVKNFHRKESYDLEFGGFLTSGNLIKSKFKILNKSYVFFGTGNIKITDWSTWSDKQYNAVQVVDIDLPGHKKLRVMNYHGIWTKEKIGNKDTLEACKKINDLAKDVDYPVIIAGDFNLFPDTDSMKVFKDFKSLVDIHDVKTTRPSTNELSSLERNVVDYIIVSNQIKVKSFKVLDSDVSDHLPLVLEFDL